VIVMSLDLALQQLVAFRRVGIPLVTVDVSAPGVPHTITDDVTGGRLATAHLLGLGHRRIAFVGDSNAGRVGLRFGSSRRRLEGYRRELRAAGLWPDPDLVRTGPHGAAVAAALTGQLLALPDPPTAIFAASDTQAIGALSAADRAGISVPDRLSVIGFDDIESAALFGLSTVCQPLKLSGAEASRRLCALVRREQVRPLRQMLSLRVVHRASSAAPAVTGAAPHVRPPRPRSQVPTPLEGR
jgi:DNA-binding LacI/PurR family transcriptional regulator